MFDGDRRNSWTGRCKRMNKRKGRKERKSTRLSDEVTRSAEELESVSRCVCVGVCVYSSVFGVCVRVGEGACDTGKSGWWSRWMDHDPGETTRWNACGREQD